jgi:hypothetical protein
MSRRVQAPRALIKYLVASQVIRSGSVVGAKAEVTKMPTAAGRPL